MGVWGRGVGWSRVHRGLKAGMSRTGVWGSREGCGDPADGVWGQGARGRIGVAWGEVGVAWVNVTVGLGDIFFWRGA